MKAKHSMRWERLASSTPIKVDFLGLLANARQESQAEATRTFLFAQPSNLFKSQKLSCLTCEWLTCVSRGLTLIMNARQSIFLFIFDEHSHAIRCSAWHENVVDEASTRFHYTEQMLINPVLVLTFFEVKKSFMFALTQSDIKFIKTDAKRRGMLHTVDMQI